MSEPNMGFVVLGPVLGPADIETGPVSIYKVHLIAQRRKPAPNSFHEVNTFKPWGRDGMMQTSVNAKADCMQLPLIRGVDSTYRPEGRQEIQ